MDQTRLLFFHDLLFLTTVKMTTKKVMKSGSSSTPNFVPMSLESLPHDILLKICSRVGRYSVADMKRLEMVSKSFQTVLCKNKEVLQQIPLHQIPLLPMYENPLPPPLTNSWIYAAPRGT